VPAWPSPPIGCGTHPLVPICLRQIGPHKYEHCIFGDPVAKPHGTAHRVRVIIFRVVAAPAGLFFVVAVVLMASAPWVLLQPDEDVRTEPNRWFLTVAGSVDAITAGVLLALARRLRRTLLVLELAGAVILAGAIILPFQPTFAAILAIGVVPLIAYQYWRDVRMLHMPRLAGICRPNGPALD
jgi:hypothetical protein